MSDELEPPGLYPVLELRVEVISVSTVCQQLDYVLSFVSGSIVLLPLLWPSMNVARQNSSNFSLLDSIVHRIRHTAVTNRFVPLWYILILEVCAKSRAQSNFRSP